MLKKIFLIASGLAGGILTSAFVTSTDIINSINLDTVLPKENFSATDVSGKKITIGQVKDKKGLLVVFVSNTCTFFTQSTDRLNQISQYAINNKVGVLLINSNEQFRDRDDSFIKMQEAKTQKNILGYYIADSNSELADAFGATRTPECFLFDANSKLVYKGALDVSPAKPGIVSSNYLKDALNALINNKTIITSSTKPIGCEVKRKVK